MWRSLQDAFELEEPALVEGVPVEITDVVDGGTLRAAYAAARASGAAALILAEADREGQHWLGDFDMQTRLAAARARYDAEAAAPFAGVEVARAEAALDELGAIVGGDPMAVLHRVDVQWLEEDGFDPELLAPDDVREAYEAARAERGGGEGGLRLVQGPVRTYDAESALAELCPGRGRVVKLGGCSQAQAMLHVGFGGWNACPGPARQARVWEHWYRTIGAEPVVLGADTLGAIVGAPIRERALLVRTAAEIAAYDPDALVEGYLALLATIARNTSLSFWWD